MDDPRYAAADVGDDERIFATCPSRVSAGQCDPTAAHAGGPAPPRRGHARIGPRLQRGLTARRRVPGPQPAGAAGLLAGCARPSGAARHEHSGRTPYPVRAPGTARGAARATISGRCDTRCCRGGGLSIPHCQHHTEHEHLNRLRHAGQVSNRGGSPHAGPPDRADRLVAEQQLLVAPPDRGPAELVAALAGMSHPPSTTENSVSTTVRTRRATEKGASTSAAWFADRCR